MRQSAREIIDIAKIESVIHQSQTCRLALWDQDFPYIVPMNFGYSNGCLFFHCAPEGKKIDLIRRDPRVGFELEAVAEVESNQDLACRWTTRYQSVIGSGRAFLLESDGEKRNALDIIMSHYATHKDWQYDQIGVSKMIAIKVEIERMTAKQSKHFLQN